MLQQFNNLRELDEAFPTDQTAIDHFRTLRWPNGAACHECGSVKVYTLAGEWHKCGDCKKKFSVRHDTIFADSKLSLRTWFRAIFLMTSHKKGISSAQLARDLGIMQKSAWHLLHRIQEATVTEEFNRPLLTGKTQLDESYVGGKEQFKHKAKRTPFTTGGGSARTKSIVFGMLNDSGELRMQTIPYADRRQIEKVVLKNIRHGSVTHTDEATHYKWMVKHFEHSLVKHRFGQYVADDGTHTNGIEGAFSHFKRAVTGVYHKVSDEQIDRYLSMFSWRWTRRKMGEGERVNALLKSTQGHQLTYRKLTRKDNG